ncbi:TPA: phage protein NinX family protein [Salmonella enterica]
MDYSQLSDFEINKLVANATGTQVEETYQFVNGGEDIADHMSGIVLMRKITSNRKHWKLYDPCNNASDAWPIIQDNFISIIFDEDGNEPPQNAWCKTITKTGESHYGSEKEPLKTAMIAFLMKANKCTFCDGNGFIQIDHGENIGIEHKACPQCEGKCYVHP